MYKAIFAAAYFGLLQISEVAGLHAILARNVHIGTNKKKFLFILEISKTHNRGDKPQMVKITSKPLEHFRGKPRASSTSSTACPFTIIKYYIQLHPSSHHSGEPFCVFKNNIPVQQLQIRNMLKVVIAEARLDATYYTFHGFRTGRSSDLLKLGISIETIKKVGRWRSNVVFAYLK